MTNARLWVGCLCLLTSLLITQPAAAEPIDPMLRADIEKLLDVTGTSEAGTRMAHQTTEYMLEGLRASRPYVSEKTLTAARRLLAEEFAKAYAAPDGLSARLIEVYARHFTHEEVKGLLQFYDSALGRKTVELMPLLMQESAAAGQDWMRAHMPQIRAALDARLKAEGLN